MKTGGIIMSRTRTLFLVSTCLLVPAISFAKPVPSSGGNATVSQLDALHDQIAVLKQELEVAKLKAGIKNAGNPNASMAPPALTGFPGLAYGQPPRPATTIPQRPSHTLPRIVAIDGRGTRLSALLLMPDGGEIVAKPGLGLGDGLTVHDITASGVRVMKAGDLVPLPFVGNRDNAPARTDQGDTPPASSPAVFPPSLPGAAR